MSEISLKDKVVIITGGSTEVAGTVAVALAKAGARVCLCGKQADLLNLTAQRITDSGGVCVTTVSDLDTLESATSVLELTQQNFGNPDILILVSPFWAGGYIHAHNLKTWDLVMNANLREAFIMARTILPVFREQTHGEIVSIGSDSSLGIYEQDGAFNVAMHALTTLMELIQKENQSLGIRTHLLSPGVALTTDTDSTGQPALMAEHIAEWVLWLLTRPAHLRSNGNLMI